MITGYLTVGSVEYPVIINVPLRKDLKYFNVQTQSVNNTLYKQKPF